MTSLKEKDTALDARHSPEMAIAEAIIPWPKDDEKAMFLGYRASGLSVREALQMVNRGKSWLSWIRTDARFADLEGRIPEFRKTLAKEYIELEFYRNFRLALEKDYQVLKKSISKEPDEDGKLHTTVLSRQEHEYLIKLRSQYTPAQIQILEAVVTGSNGGFDFAKFVSENPDIVQLSRTTETMTVVNKKVEDEVEAEVEELADTIEVE